MFTNNQPTCLIRQSACGRIAGEPVCPKCGLDDRVRYVSEEAGLLAASNANAQFLENEAKERETLEKKKNEEAHKHAENERLQIERGKAEEAKRQAAKELKEIAQRREVEDAKRQAEIERLEQEEVKRLAAEQAQREALERQREKESKKESHGGWLKPTSIVALILVVGGTNVYRKMEQRNEREYAKIAQQAIAMATRDDVLSALSPSAAQQPSIKDCAACPELVPIPAGNFQMGSPDGDATQQPIHPVSIKGFLLGKYEVTQSQWKTAMGSNPSHFKSCGDQCPVDNVTWDDVQRYLKKLNQISGQKYRLPSEAEWEFAARADAKGKWSFGDEESKLRQYVWFSANSGEQPHPVGQKMAGTLGLHDIFGNVGEWVQDCFHSDYKGAPNDGSVWTTSCNPNSRGIRGGSSIDEPTSVGPSLRFSALPVVPLANIGFRIARSNVSSPQIKKHETEVVTTLNPQAAWPFPTANKP